MTYQTGTAGNHIDLADELHTLLLSEGWTQLTTADTLDSDGFPRLYKAPGLTGTDPCYVGIGIPYADAVNDIYAWPLYGFTGHQASQAFTAQPGAKLCGYLPLWNDATPYFFTVNAQRAIIVAKVSTSYQYGYLGKFLPYGTPQQYPYPVLVCGMYNSAVRWSTAALSGLVNPYRAGYLYVPGGTWQQIDNVNSNTSSNGIGVWPTFPATAASSVLSSVQAWEDGGYTLLPLLLREISATYRGANVYGEAEGLFWVTGHQNTAENVITIGSDEYIVFQNGNKTSLFDYFALKKA